jgi:hypothetical protein
MYIYMLPYQRENRKLKPRKIFIDRLPFSACANGSYPFANGLNGLKRLN